MKSKAGFVRWGNKLINAAQATNNTPPPTHHAFVRFTAASSLHASSEAWFENGI
jgi:hypothetical protein